MGIKNLKRAVIKEEYVALTGDMICAVILNQFIYWTKRMEDFDKYIEEEKARARNNGIEITVEPTNGWIYKSAEKLAEEIMLGKSPQTVLRYIKILVENGWLEERFNPTYKWDREKQYRVNLAKVKRDLEAIGYELQEDIILGDDKDNSESNPDKEVRDPFSVLGNAYQETEIPFSKIENASSILENRFMKNGRAIPEIIDIETRDTETREKEIKEQKSFLSEPDVSDAQLKRRIPVFDEGSIQYRLAAYMRQRILENLPTAKVPALTLEGLKRWAYDIDLMIRIDGRSPDSIKELIDWSQKDSFWKANILSPGKLRQKWDTLTAHRLRDIEKRRSLNEPKGWATLRNMYNKYRAEEGGHTL